MFKNEYEPASSLYSRIRWTQLEATQILLVVVCSILAPIPLFQETLLSNQNLKGYMKFIYEKIKEPDILLIFVYTWCDTV